MDKNCRLPFKVGQLAESRSFLTGFRGAWFRCQINDIKWTNGHQSLELEFFDFPDEKVRLTKVYQKSPYEKFLPRQKKKLHLMVRPPFPPLYSENEITDIHEKSELLAIVGEWKVGDLVDWWSDGCFWSGRIVCLLGSDKVKIDLPSPPWGEGHSYEAFCKDLRPSLDWSLEYGWTVPLSEDSEASRCCVRLIAPLKQGNGLPSEKNDAGLEVISGDSNENADFSTSNASSSSFNPFLHDIKSSDVATIDLHKQTSSRVSNMDMHPSYKHRIAAHRTQKFSNDTCSSQIPLPCNVEEDPQTDMSSSSKTCDENATPSKKMGLIKDGWVAPLVTCDNESSLLGLEELALKIRWIKRILKFGPQWSDSMEPSWKFVENRSNRK